MDRLKMAHEYAIALINSDCEMQFDKFIQLCWNYADAMQDEAEKRECKERPDVLKEEWQPDWSQAPDNLVQYFAVDENGRGGWFINKPELCSDHWYWSDFEERFNNDCYDHAPSFNYQGNWKESLRKRPEALREVDWRVAPEWARYWATREDSGTALWCINKPTVTGDCFLSHGGCSPAPSFGFTGTHIAERPHGF